MRKPAYPIVVTTFALVIWALFMIGMWDAGKNVMLFFSGIIAVLYCLCMHSCGLAFQKRRMLDAMEAVARNTAQRQS